MIDNLFNATLALTLLVGSALAMGSALQDPPPSARTAQIRTPEPAPAHLIATAQADTVRNPLR